MGYCFDHRGRLACDACGESGQTRKRTCPHTVTNERGQTLPYCQPPALCPACWSKHKAKAHEGCAEGAARSQASYDEDRRRLDAGDYKVASAFGHWHETVPDCHVGVYFRNDHAELRRLVHVNDYNPTTKPYLSDYPEATDWPNVKGGGAK